MKRKNLKKIPLNRLEDRFMDKITLKWVGRKWHKKNGEVGMPRQGI